MEEPRLKSRTTYQYVAAVLLPVLAVVGGVLYFGSAQKMIAVLDGQLLMVKSSEIVAASSDEAESTGDIASFTILNVTDSELRVVGCHSACTCITMTGLPITVSPSGECELAFRVTGTRDRKIDESIVLFTVPSGTPVRLRVATNPSQFATTDSDSQIDSTEVGDVSISSTAVP